MDKTLKVLVVDDEPDVVEILSYNLTRENYKVYKAYNGSDGLRVAHEVHPDLVIMDIRMPGVNGIEACRQMKQDADTRDIPVLFLTADADEYTTMNAIEAGGDHFITKPIRPQILMGMIAELIR
jgi:two-component system alkaline phosphatase synthesis response regulator PhoP